MLSDEAIEQYRKMTPSERLKIAFQMIEASWQYMHIGPPEVVARKRELWERENDERNRRILEVLARSKGK